ncbi:unnamed protein product [Enterobius vermicularis]|uniref:FLYWCH-type domain-containing protein n=1 Tax=Enterobius vermicularis TaxID=51028 RepID=A0A0N4VKY5_ENTVE|nr:unnamed protein product [Enterobius vermicularis]
MASDERVADESTKYLELCTKGIVLQRVKRGRLTPSYRVYLQDQKWFCYCSSGFWKCVPTKLKSVLCLSDVLTE